MVDVDTIIAAELERIAPFGGSDGLDWSDVLRRAGDPARPGSRAPRRRRRYLALALALLLVAVAAPALAFRAAIVDFLGASPAPEHVVVDFHQLKVIESLPPGRGAGAQVLPGRARRITSVRVNGASSTLYVAPTESGGFCAVWTNGALQCVDPGDRRGRSRYARVGYGAMTPTRGVDTIEGSIFVRDATVKLLYADGASTVIPFVWVTAPIRAGFFIYGVPESRRLGTARPIAVVVSRNGRTLMRQPIDDTAATTRIVDHRDRWGAVIQTTPEAVWSKRRLLWSFNLADGALAELWVMPSREGPGRRCVVSSLFGFGCEAVPLRGAALRLRLAGGGYGTTVITGETAAAITRVRLRFQDGSTQVVTPKEGVVLAELEPRRYPIGHRLVEAIGLDADGRPVASTTFDPHVPATYPCAKPKRYGYGVRECP